MRPDARLLVIGPPALGQAVSGAFPKSRSITAENLLAGVWTLGQGDFEGVVVSLGLGPEVASAVRNLRKVAPAARIIAAVDPSDEPAVRKVIEAGADDYVLEPVLREDLEEAFEQSAYALMATITPDLKRIFPLVKKTIKVQSEDKKALLFDFLSEFLYIFDVEGLVFSSVNIPSIKKVNEGFELEAVLKGEKFNKEKHELGTEVKAITYSYMEIEEKKNKTEINVIFDI